MPRGGGGGATRYRLRHRIGEDAAVNARISIRDAVEVVEALAGIGDAVSRTENRFPAPRENIPEQGNGNVGLPSQADAGREVVHIGVVPASTVVQLEARH